MPTEHPLRSTPTVKSRRFRLLPFRSPLLREYLRKIGGYFMFLWVLRCFTSPGALCRSMNSSDNTLAFRQVGFPIRISPDHRLLATSPKLIAGCYVLHRLAVSRHPPSTLVRYSTTRTTPLPTAHAGNRWHLAVTLKMLLLPHLFSCQRSRVASVVQAAEIIGLNSRDYGSGRRSLVL